MRTKIIWTFLFLFFITATYAEDNCSDRYRSVVFKSTAFDGQVDYDSWSKRQGGQVLRYDVYSPKGDTAALRPLVILWHGGAFVDMIKKNSPDILRLAKDLARMGYVVITPDYRGLKNLLDFGNKEALIKVVVKATLDGHDAVCHILSQIDNGNPYRINKNEIFGGGSSAGAILSLHGLFLNTSDDLGEYTQWARQVDKGRVDEVLANKFCSSENIFKGFFSISGGLVDTSFMTYTDVNFLHIHGTKDDFVPFDIGQPLGGLTAAPDLFGSKPIHEKCDELGINSDFMIFEGGGHVPYMNLEPGDLFSDLDLINEERYQLTLHRIADFLFNQITCEKASEAPTAIFNKSIQTLTAYPNPAEKFVRINMPEYGIWNLEVYNLTGKLVSDSHLQGQSLEFHTENLSKGIYLIKLSDSNNPGKSYLTKITKVND